MYLIKWGGPSFQLPKVSGRLFFVAPSSSYNLFGKNYSASDDHRGEDPDKALASVVQALSLCSDGYDDAIILLPGAHTITASLALAKSKLTLMGLAGTGRGNFIRPKTSLTISASDEIANVTAADIEIANLRLIPITTKPGIDFSAAGDNLYIHDCSFDMATPAVNTGLIAIDATGAASNVLLEHNYFECDGAQGAAMDMTGTLDSAVVDSILYCSAGSWAAGITVGAATARLHIDNTKFLCSGTAITAGIDGTGATVAKGVSVTRCMFSDLVTVAIDNFDAGECEIAENYQLGLGATDGGVLITAIT